MIGDYWNDSGIETNMNTVASVKDTRTEKYHGMHILTGGLTDDKIPYSLVIDGGPVDIDTGIPRNPSIDFRVSLLSPEYLQCDRLFTKEERKIFNDIMHKEWDHVIYLCHDYHTNWYSFGDILDTNSKCPNYLELETM